MMITETETIEAIGTEVTTDLVATVIAVHPNPAASRVRNRTTDTQDTTGTRETCETKEIREIVIGIATNVIADNRPAITAIASGTESVT